MRKTFRFLLMLIVALALMLVFRAVGLTIYSIEGDGLEPYFVAGDRVMVNRWSYGLRVGGSHDGLFRYGRLWRQSVERGDVVAFEHPHTGDVMVCRCKALPGDTIDIQGVSIVVPSLKGCADADYYWMESINPNNTMDSRQMGFISEEYIIGRVFMIAYYHQPGTPLWTGWEFGRMFLLL